jgi:hypothetical protein
LEQEAVWAPLYLNAKEEVHWPHVFEFELGVDGADDSVEDVDGGAREDDVVDVEEQVDRLLALAKNKE